MPYINVTSIAGSELVVWITGFGAGDRTPGVAFDVMRAKDGVSSGEQIIASIRPHDARALAAELVKAADKAENKSSTIDIDPAFLASIVSDFDLLTQATTMAEQVAAFLLLEDSIGELAMRHPDHNASTGQIES